MSSTTKLKPHPQKSGWFTYGTYTVTPTGRLCDRPGGAMRGQIVKSKFNALKNTASIAAHRITSSTISVGSITGRFIASNMTSKSIKPIQEEKPIMPNISSVKFTGKNGVVVTLIKVR